MTEEETKLPQLMCFYSNIVDKYPFFMFVRPAEGIMRTVGSDEAIKCADMCRETGEHY